MDGYADETDAGCEDCTCSGTGYESKTLGGVTVYVDCNKDKCWTPTITKTWGPTGGAKASCIGAGSSYPACNYCDNLVYGGFTDWILPNKTDLKALCATTTVCPDPPNTCFGGDGVSGYYWSSRDTAQIGPRSYSSPIFVHITMTSGP
ncbi:MAG: hypothetical protein WAX07_05800 [Candidatus Altiarchaeia archaeon]